MLQTVKGIVLDAFKFKETTLVSRIYTKEYGLISIMVSGLGSRKSMTSQIYFQPLSLIEFSIHIREKKGLMRASNLSLQESTLGYNSDVKKYAIAVFIAEVVLRTCKENEVEETLYELLNDIVYLFKHPSFQDLHLFFLSSYSNILGLSMKAFYDSSESMIGQEFGEDIHEQFFALCDMTSYQPLNITRDQRNKLVRFLLFYFEKNVGMPKIKSMTVLEELFA